MSKTMQAHTRRQRRREAAQARERQAREASQADRFSNVRPVLFFLLLLFGLPIFLISTVVLPELQTALGMSGTPGTATVLSCEKYRKGRNTKHDCKARFVFKDSARPPVVLKTVADVEVGETFPAAINSEGNLVLPTGARGVWRRVPPIASVFGIPALLMIIFGFADRSWGLGIGGIALALATAAAMIAGSALGGGTGGG